MKHTKGKSFLLLSSLVICSFLLIVLIAPKIFATVPQSDLTHLPLGDGKISHTDPQVGYVYILRSNFRNGRNHSGDWIHDDGTFDLTEKPTVQGAVHWQSQLDVKVEGDSRTLTGSSRVISGNALPDHATGIFPIAPSDPAHQYDPNPNAISKKLYSLTLPVDPKVASQSSPLTMGPIGIMLSGAFLFNALDDAGLDAEAHEIQDACQGHPQKFGIYHYHSFSTCIKTTDMPNSSQLVGYALDGFGIYVEYGADGKLLTNKDLDADHGRTSEVKWNGKTESIYHYDVTHEYPYTMGAYKGSPIDFNLRS